MVVEKIAFSTISLQAGTDRGDVLGGKRLRPAQPKRLQPHLSHSIGSAWGCTSPSAFVEMDGIHLKDTFRARRNAYGSSRQISFFVTHLPRQNY